MWAVGNKRAIGRSGSDGWVRPKACGTAGLPHNLLRQSNPLQHLAADRRERPLWVETQSFVPAPPNGREAP
jgi:hypothetical protein